MKLRYGSCELRTYIRRKQFSFFFTSGQQFIGFIHYIHFYLSKLRANVRAANRMEHHTIFCIRLLLFIRVLSVKSYDAIDGSDEY